MIDRNETSTPDMETAVAERYAAAARAVEPALCCPVEYSADFLSIIPEEILAKDDGCGDPTPYVRRGDTVVDLGSGGGKLCYILSQEVGAEGKVVGIDCNRDMLALARKYQAAVSLTPACLIQSNRVRRVHWTVLRRLTVAAPHAGPRTRLKAEITG